MGLATSGWDEVDRGGACAAALTPSTRAPSTRRSMPPRPLRRRARPCASPQRPAWLAWQRLGRARSGTRRDGRRAVGRGVPPASTGPAGRGGGGMSC
eukprot:scaffold7374_cov112-Isochrysis_galbana.AAC.28